MTLDFPSTVYPIIFADYRPRPTTNVVGFGANVTFVYRNDALAGLKVVQITSTDNNGQNAEVFTAPEYTSYLQTERDAGVREGIVVIVVGVVIAILALTIPIVSRRRVGLRQAKR